MHCEDDDYNLPIALQERRHGQKIEGLLEDIMRNWRLKERVSRVEAFVAYSLLSPFLDENSLSRSSAMSKRWR